MTMRYQIIAGIILGCFLSVSSMAAERKSYPMNVRADGVQRIVFDVQEGDFVLRGSPDAKEIRMMVSIDRMWIFKLGEQDILKRLISISGEGSPEVTIRTDIPRGILSFGRAAYPIDFEIVVPERANLSVRDTSGKIEIEDMQGNVAAQDGSGTVSFWNLRGGLSLRKQSGDVKTRDISGVAMIDSETGQMNLQDMGELEIRDANGNITVVGASSARIRSRGGNLRVSNVKGNVQVDNESGEIILSRIGGSVDVRDTSGQIRTADTGPLTIRDTSGDITVRRAASLNVAAKESGAIAAGGISGSLTVPASFKVKQLK
jgi:DUF4097 and DUF4098 domain-containing protein YvlB